MWLMPSYGRPAAPRKLLDAPGGMPPAQEVLVLVNADDPALPEYVGNCPFPLLEAPAGSRFADAVRFAFEQHPNEAYYGIIDDDYWPVTAGWWDLMLAAAGTNGVAIANNRQNFPKPYCCRVMGGELARAIGTIAPGRMKHNFSDDAWEKVARDFGVYRPLEHVIVEHRHHLFRPEVQLDATYARGSGDLEMDRACYEEWLRSPSFAEQYARVAALLGKQLFSLKGLHLAFCVPMQDMEVGFAYHRSLHATARLCASRGLNISIHEVAGGSHIGKARERALWGAWKHQPTHLVWIDNDMGWDPELIVRLITSDHEFCAAVGVRKVEQLSLCCNFLRNEKNEYELHPRTGFLRVRDVGFGFVMMKRSVIDRLCQAHPELRYNTGDQPAEFALFMDMIDTVDGPYGERLSEDYSFCRRWSRIGGEIWIDPEAALTHAGVKEYTGRPRDILVDLPAEPVELKGAA